MSLLEKEPMYGYQLIKELEKKSDNVFSLKEGTLYPILHSLESEGMVESYWSGEEGARQRKYYRITTKGQKLLTEKKQEWKTFRSAVDNVIMREAFIWR